MLLVYTESDQNLWEGRQIVFTSDRDGDAEIFLVSRDGSGLAQLTTNTAADGYAVLAP